MYKHRMSSNIIQYPYISAQTHEDLAVWSQGLQSDNITRMFQECPAKVGMKRHPSRLAHARWPQFAAGHGRMWHSKPTLIHDVFHKAATQVSRLWEMCSSSIKNSLQISSPMEQTVGQHDTLKRTQTYFLWQMEGKAIFERPTAVNEANAGQWPHCFTRFVIHFDNHPIC